ANHELGEHFSFQARSKRSGHLPFGSGASDGVSSTWCRRRCGQEQSQEERQQMIRQCIFFMMGTLILGCAEDPPVSFGGSSSSGWRCKKDGRGRKEDGSAAASRFPGDSLRRIGKKPRSLPQFCQILRGRGTWASALAA